jgi:hypothetical protein
MHDKVKLEWRGIGSQHFYRGALASLQDLGKFILFSPSHVEILGADDS